MLEKIIGVLESLGEPSQCTFIISKYFDKCYVNQQHSLIELILIDLFFNVLHSIKKPRFFISFDEEFEKSNSQ